MVELGRTENLLNVLNQYEVLGSYRLSLNQEAWQVVAWGWQESQLISLALALDRD